MTHYYDISILMVISTKHLRDTLLEKDSGSERFTFYHYFHDFCPLHQLYHSWSDPRTTLLGTIYRALWGEFYPLSFPNFFSDHSVSSNSYFLLCRHRHEESSSCSWYVWLVSATSYEIMVDSVFPIPFRIDGFTLSHFLWLWLRTMTLHLYIRSANGIDLEMTKKLLLVMIKKWGQTHSQKQNQVIQRKYNWLSLLLPHRIILHSPWRIILLE